LPRPLLTATVSESALTRLKAGFLVITEHDLSGALQVIAIVLGLAPFLKAPLVMGFIALPGSRMLLWIRVDVV